MSEFEESQTPLELIVNPIAPLVEAGRTPAEAMVELRARALPELESLVERLKKATRTHSKIDEKSLETAIEKSQRETTLKKYSWFRIDHLRDFLRFRTALNSLADAVSIVDFFRSEAAAGAIRLVKFDTSKLSEPSVFGWRMIATDLRLMESGMLVEHYMTYGDVIAASDLMLHRVFEKWRTAKQLTKGSRQLRANDSRLVRLSNDAVFFECLAKDVSFPDNYDGEYIREAKADYVSYLTAEISQALHTSLDNPR